MIIYGWNTKTIEQSSIAYECKNCGEKDAWLVIFAHYAHLFWIPFFPYKKSATIVCKSCGNGCDEAFLSNENKETLKRFKSKARIPMYLFAGLMLIGLGIAYLFINNYLENNRQKAYIANPQIGDIYLVLNPEEATEFNLTFLKVNDIVGDSLWISPSSYSYSRIVSELDPNDGFYNAMYAIHKTVLIAFDEKDELKKVFRDYGSETGFEREIEYNENDSLGVATPEVESRID